MNALSLPLTRFTWRRKK